MDGPKPLKGRSILSNDEVLDIATRIVSRLFNDAKAGNTYAQLILKEEVIDGT